MRILASLLVLLGLLAAPIHPFVVGTPAGAAAMRRVLEDLQKMNLVWVSDVEAVLKAAGEKRLVSSSPFRRGVHGAMLDPWANV